ncbi:MAG: hypothetical protein AAF269_15845 [Pseudomonadota bacterium]
MNSRERRKLTKLSRFVMGAAAIALAGCASAPAKDRIYLSPNGAVSQPPLGSVDVAGIDDALAQFLSAESDHLILLPNRLDRSQLDFSLESLLVIDKWLADIHTVNRLQSETGKAGESLVMDGRGDNSVILAGLYLGQTIRANSRLNWHWERFDTFLAANPTFAEHYGRAPGLDLFVLAGPQGAATPINTALKRVVHGKEESVHFIGNFLINEVDLDAATTGQDLLGMDRRDWPG